VAKLLDRACPRCGAEPGIKCRDLRRPTKTAAREHTARGWLDRPCPTCHALPGEPCLTPSGRSSSAPHKARWERAREPAQRYGYAWVSPDEHDLVAPQDDALRAAGCVRVWADRPSLLVDVAHGSELARLLAYLQPRDVLVVWRLDRLVRTPTELAQLAARLRARQIELCSITEDLDSARPGGEQLFDAIAAIAGLQPTGAGAQDTGMRRRAARSDAAKGGRPRLLDEHAHAAVRAMYDAGERTIDQIAAAHRVSRPTVYRSLKRTEPSQNKL
jgi:DNA invertase Pin-like site-specific DNA recombinase